MEWLSDNWFWIVVGVAFVALHVFGHGGHGGHGQSSRSDRDTPSQEGAGHVH